MSRFRVIIDMEFASNQLVEKFTKTKIVKESFFACNGSGYFEGTSRRDASYVVQLFIIYYKIQTLKHGSSHLFTCWKYITRNKRQKW